jgi:DNA-binding transcriptional regulator YdaS (Cro superfamily)
MSKRRRQEIDEGLRKAIEAAGSIRAFARKLGVTPPAVMEWRRVPAHRILQVEAVTGIPREQLRPDLYRRSVPAHGPPQPC